jgi:putative transposase
MSLAPQEIRTFFISTATWERRSILQSNPLCDLLLNVLRENRAKQRFELHEFVLMRDHLHLILTPSSLIPLEKTIQFIKGGFSFRAKKEMNFNGEIWQKGYNDQRIKDDQDYTERMTYIWMNPVKAGYVDHPDQFPYSSARLKTEIDPPPTHFQIKPRGVL